MKKEQKENEKLPQSNVEIREIVNLIRMKIDRIIKSRNEGTMILTSKYEKIFKKIKKEIIGLLR